MAKRLLCVVLSLLMIMAVLPAGVVAESNVEETASATENVEGNEEEWVGITSFSSIKESGYYKSTSKIESTSGNYLYIYDGMDVCIDFSGFGTGTGCIFVMGGTLTIYDTAESQAKVNVEIRANSGTVNIYSGNFARRVYSINGGTLNIWDGTFNATSSTIGDIGGVFADNNGTVNIFGGTFYSNVGIFMGSTGLTSAHTIDSATMNIYGGTFNTQWSNAVKIYNSGRYVCDDSVNYNTVTITNSSLNIIDGTFNVTVSNENTTDSNVLTVTGGSFLTSKNSALEEYVAADYTAYTEGDYTKVATGVYRVAYNSNNGSGDVTYSTAFESGGSVTIADNTFTYDNCTFTGWNTAADGSGTSYVVGNTFDITENITLYAQWTPDADVVAKIEETGVYYEDLAEAIDVAEEGQTVTLVKDVTLSEMLKIYKSITLDLGDYKICFTSSTTSDATIYTTKSLTIKADEGGIYATGCRAINNQLPSYGTNNLTIDGGSYYSDSQAAIFNIGGTLNIVSGSISTGSTSANGITNSGDASVLNISGGTITGNWAVSVSAGTVTVTGGTISGTNRGIYIKTGSLAISGGTVSANTPISVDNSSTYGTDVTVSVSGGHFSKSVSSDYCAAGYVPCTETEGDYYTAGVPYTVKYNGPAIYSATLTLDGAIGVNFYVNPNGVDMSGYTMSFTVNDEDAGTASYDTSKYVTVSDTPYYGFTVSLTPTQMADTITATLKDGSGNVVGTATYSVVTYCTSAIKDSGNAKLIALCEALLNYGGYSQIYFDYNTTTLANSTLSTLDGSWSDLVENWSDVDLSSYTVSASLPSSISGGAVTLILESKTAIRLYFNSSSKDNLTFTVDGSTLTINDTASTDAGYGTYSYYVEFDVVSGELSTNYTISIADSTDSGSYSVTYSAMAYVKEVVNSSSTSEALKNVCKALYCYSVAADAYFG